MKSTAAVAQDLLNATLSKKWIEEIRLSDSWSIRFSNDLWLVAQDLDFPVETTVKSLLSSHAPDLLARVDSEDVPKMTCLSALMRRGVTQCRVEEAGTLSISFEGGGELRANVNVPIADWMWSIGSSPGDPYMTPRIACCFGAGEIDTGGAGRNSTDPSRE
jgi:hypothetical protein